MMIIVGKTISFLALLLMRSEWRKLKEDLICVSRMKSSVITSIPHIAVAALIMAEDHRFNRHVGVDLLAIGRAIWHLVLGKARSGGSTIEQQLVRTITRRYERTLKRKAREILLASLVHRVIPKEKIPALYLSVAYFGWQMNGIQEACERLCYELRKMSLRQAISIVARLKYPEPQNVGYTRKRQITYREQHLVRLAGRQAIARYPYGGEVEANAAVHNI